MQVKIFTGRSYDVVESDVNAWLSANNDYTIEQISTAVDSKNNIVMTVIYDDKVAKSWDMLKDCIRQDKTNVGEEFNNDKGTNWLSEVVCDTTDNAINWINEHLRK
jgi:hypothetical protein